MLTAFISDEAVLYRRASAMAQNHDPDEILGCGTVIYVRGVTSEDEAHVGVIVNEDFWLARLGPDVPGHFTRGRDYPYRMVGIKVLQHSPTLRSIGEPDRPSVPTYLCRQRNLTAPLAAPRLGEVEELIVCLRRMRNLAESGRYIESVITDLEVLWFYIHAWTGGTIRIKDTSRLSPYKKDLLTLFEQAIPL